MLEQFAEKGGVSAEILSADTLYDFQRITSNHLSPDGQQIVFAVERIDRQTEKKHSDLWLVAADGSGEPRRFTRGDSADSDPQWSPDGSQIAFISNRGDAKQPQLYLIPVAGGEARQLTDLNGILVSYDWAPNSRQIAYLLLSPDADTLAREQDENLKKLGVVAYHITDIYYKADGLGFVTNRYCHLWVIDVDTDEATQKTAGEFSVVQVAWSPDSSTLALIANLQPDVGLHVDDAQIYTISATLSDPITGDQLTLITEHKGMIHGLSYAPDGQHIAFYAYEQMSKWCQNVNLYVVSAQGGGARNLTEQHDLEVGANTINDIGGTTPTSAPVWAHDGQTIYIQVARHGKQPLMAIAFSGESASVVLDGVIGLFQFNQTGTRLSYLKADFEQPGELFVYDTLEETTTQLTQQHAWLQDLALGSVEEVWFEASDGYALQGWILTPPNFDPTQTYPSVMEIHGGPQTQYGAFFMHEFYYMAAQGYVIYFCNPRGGQGYGNAHCAAIHGKWGTVDYTDLMTWADYMAAQPYIDQARMGVAGGSYGGYMTSWIIGHTNRFAAACSQRAVTNWTSMWGSTDFNYNWTRLAGVPHPWENIELNWQQSPMSQIQNAQTPTLVIHSMNDYRTNLEQSEQLYVALKILGIDTELIIFPEESHGLSRNGRTDRRIARLRHILRWFDTYLK